jgi:hypothetical protein
MSLCLVTQHCKSGGQELLSRSCLVSFGVRGMLLERVERESEIGIAKLVLMCPLAGPAADSLLDIGLKYI